MTRIADRYFWMDYRRHVGTVVYPACACDLNGPDRACDLGWALFHVACSPKKPQA